jgi:hypothetical protein
MRRLICLLVVALVLPAAASAKEFTSLRLCGTNGCHTTRDKAQLGDAMAVEPQAAPDRGAAFYRVRITIGEPGLHGEGAIHSQWIPSLHLLRNDDGPLVEFSLPHPPTERMLRRLGSGLRPFAAAKLGRIGGAARTARVDETVAAPSSGGGGGHDGGGGSGWAWSLLAIVPAGMAFWLLRRRRRSRPSLA